MSVEQAPGMSLTGKNNTYCTHSPRSKPGPILRSMCYSQAEHTFCKCPTGTHIPNCTNCPRSMPGPIRRRSHFRRPRTKSHMECRALRLADAASGRHPVLAGRKAVHRRGIAVGRRAAWRGAISAGAVALPSGALGIACSGEAGVIGVAGIPRAAWQAVRSAVRV